MLVMDSLLQKRKLTELKKEKSKVTSGQMHIALIIVSCYFALHIKSMEYGRCRQ
jgi:hypothetical protein